MSFDDKLAAISAANQIRTLPPVIERDGRYIRFDDHVLVNFSSNDYLGLSNHSEIERSAIREIEDVGFGAGSARLVSGNSPANTLLEEELAKLFGGRALLFSTGYMANVGILPALADKDSDIFSDELNHASIIDGCRLAGGRTQVFLHNDLEQLDAMLKDSTAASRWIVTESVFSMSGDSPPFGRLAELARAHCANLYVDEAHAVGWAGSGKGLCSEAGICPDVLVGTFGKAWGGYGAFCIGSESIIELLVNRARSFIFTTGLPPAILAASAEAVRLTQTAEGQELRNSLSARMRQFAEGLRGLGVAAFEQTPIFPIPLGTETRALESAGHLRKHGFFCQAIRPPTVPSNGSRLRITIRADHEPEEIEALLTALGSYPGLSSV